MHEIGEKLFNRRKELGLTLEQVGDAVGVGKSTVRKWENGMIRNMGRDKIAALAKVLQINPVELVPGDSPQSTMALSPVEHDIIIAYRQADELDRAMVRRALHLEEKNDSSESEISTTL